MSILLAAQKRQQQGEKQQSSKLYADSDSVEAGAPKRSVTSYAVGLICALMVFASALWVQHNSAENIKAQPIKPAPTTMKEVEHEVLLGDIQLLSPEATKLNQPIVMENEEHIEPKQNKLTDDAEYKKQKEDKTKCCES